MSNAAELADNNDDHDNDHDQLDPGWSFVNCNFQKEYDQFMNDSDIDKVAELADNNEHHDDDHDKLDPARSLVNCKSLKEYDQFTIDSAKKQDEEQTLTTYEGLC